MDDLKKLRAELDKIDREILDLICARVDIVKKIGEVKKGKGGEVVDLERENQIIEKLKIKIRKNNLDEELIKKIWKILFEYSYKLEKES